MSRADISRIVDVLPVPPSQEPAPDDAPRGDATETLDGERISLWSTSENAVVRRQGVGPTIGIEHVMLPGVLDRRLVMLLEPESDRARSYRLLRHRLLSLGDPRVIAVTSARPGEGKTTCALNLAFAIAEDTMMRVLLLEANLRRPALFQVLGFQPTASLVENIVRFMYVGPPYPVAALSGTRLHVAALPGAPLADGRLDRTLFSMALFDLREAYDYIVIDASSVLESADADVIGECSSGVVMTARAGASRSGDLRSAVEQLAPATVLGTVLLDV